jgi:L-iditol 2-dehydrogenase
VIAIGRRKTQLDRAAALGADDLVTGGDHHDPVSQVRALTHGRGVDIGIEAVGKPQTWEWAAGMARRGGTVNFFGGCPNDSRVHLDTALLHFPKSPARRPSITRLHTSAKRWTWFATATSPRPSL